MSEKESQVVVSLSEGIVETLVEEVSGGVVGISENTRLSKLRGSLYKRPRYTEVGAGSIEPGTVCGGMATTADNVTALFLRYPWGPRKIADDTVAELRSPLSSDAKLNAYFPYTLDQAGGAAGLYGCQQSIAVDGVGRIWMAGIRANGLGGYSVYVSVQDASGKLLCPSFNVATPSTTGFPTASLLAVPLLNWVGLTAHGSKVVVWYMSVAGSPLLWIKGARLAFDDSTLEVVVEDDQNVHQISAVNLTVPQLYHYCQADVVTDPSDPDRVYLLCTSSVQDTSADLRHVNINTWSTSSSVQLTNRFTTGTVNQRHMAVSAFTINTTRHLAVITSDITFGGGSKEDTQLTMFYLDPGPGSIVQVWNEAFPADMFGYVAVEPCCAETAGFIDIASIICRPQLGVGGQIGTSAEATTFFTQFDIPAGGTLGPVQMPWLKPAGRSTHIKVSNEEFQPFFPLMRHFNLTVSADVPTNPAYVADPSIEVYTPYSPTAPMTPVMRCAVDRAAPKNAPQNGNSTCVANGKLYLSYLEAKTRQAYTDGVGMRSRYVRFDLMPTTQPAVVQDNGVSYIGSSIIGVWDGNEVTEYSPLHLPKVNVALSGGTGPNLTGKYTFTAVWGWRDAYGMFRRSTCALPVTVTLSAAKPIVYVTIPSTMRNGSTQERFDCVVYATGDTAAVGTALFYAQNMEPTNTSVNGCWVFGNVPVPNEADILLYSTGRAGEQLPTECPPPAWHMCVGNSRMWLIDAEERNRLLPSMLKQTYLPFEFNGALEVNVPSSHGKLMAVANNQGTIVAFAERGIWAIPGYGPDNAGQGGQFGEPVLLSNLGCKSRDAVVQVPGGGVLFQCSDGVFAMLSGGGVERFENLDNTYTVAKPAIMNDVSEVVFMASNGLTALVYNWEVKGWTKWLLHEVSEAPASGTTFQDGAESYGLTYHPTGGRVMRVRSGLVSSGAPLRAARGWIVPESPQADLIARECWVHARLGGVDGGATCGVTVRVEADYDSAKFVERTWTEDELEDLIENGHITIAVNVHALRCRAVKVYVSEVDPAGNGINPLTLTVTYAASSGVQRRRLKEGALK